ncbi:uncharacterized protein DUF1428 [Phyllobacterium myrsinacearum]|nr:uncharacterized protein DUF1428 [Phyllobacterium myrsinacearum]
MKGSIHTVSQYIVLVLIPVPVGVVDRVLAIHWQAAQLYKQFGALDVEVYLLTEGAPKYGCVGMIETISLNADEKLLMAMDRFADQSTYKRVSEIADRDPTISDLFRELSAIADLSRAVRAEFTLSRPPLEAPGKAANC